MKILVVCSGNICRSPMGEIILQDLADAADLDLEVSSAGTLDIDGAKASKNGVLVCQENGLSLGGFKSSALSSCRLEHYNQILAMEPKHLERVRELADSLDIPIHLVRRFSGESGAGVGDLAKVPDPVGQEISVYRSSFALIKDCMEGYVNMLQDHT